MTWSYFTAYLDASRPIAKVERDELYTNLAALLGTAGCSAAGYSLNSTDQTAIKGSSLITDLASLDGPGATNTKARLHTVLETAASAFSNYSAAVSAALTAEGLTSTTRGEIISSRIDDYRLWNYYRRVINGLTCCTVTSASAAGCVGVAFSYSIVASCTPTSYDATGLPAGLSVNTSTGVISGTPTTSTPATAVTISAITPSGTVSGTLTLTITGCGSSITLSGYAEDLGESPTTCVDESQSFGDEFTCAQDVDISFVIAAGRAGRVVVKANGTDIYDSGCQAGEVTIDDTFTVPAGTTTLRVLGTCSCDSASGGSIAWGLSCA